MNYTNFEHAGYAVLMQLAVGLLSGDWFAGAMFGIAFFLGREHSQFQNKYDLGDFESFNFIKWSLDSKLDLLFPIIACVAVFYIAKYLT